jgi:hypothetical protein
MSPRPPHAFGEASTTPGAPAPARLRRLLPASILLALAGCGGGGDGSVFVQPFVVLAEVDGAPFGTALVPGVQLTENLEGGDHVVLRASPAGVQWIVSVDGNTLAADASSDSAQWSATIQSPKGGVVDITVRSAADASQQATLKLLVSPQPYTRLDWRAGEAATWRDTLERDDGSTTVATLRRATVTLAADGSHTVTTTDTTSGLLVDTVSSDADDNRLARRAAASGDTCTDTPARALLQFPLQYGRQWTSAWRTDCSGGGHVEAQATTLVEDAERITVPAGSFDTLRIRSTIAYSHSNDRNLLGGALGQARYGEVRTCWWSTQLKRHVRCDTDTSYIGGVPGSYPARLRQELLQSG